MAEHVTDFDAEIRGRIELHDTVLPMDGKYNDAILAAEVQLFQRI